jgi:hypothetical protein
VTHGPAAIGSEGLPEVLIAIAVALLVTWLLLIAALAVGHRKSKMLQLEAAYSRFSSGGAPLPDPNRGLRLKLLVLAVLVILNVGWLGLLLSRGPGEGAVESTSSQSATASGVSSSAGRPPASNSRDGSAAETIQLADLAESARPFEAVRIQGVYPGRPKIFLRVQRLERGQWLDFPLPTKTNQSGQFTTYVELERPGRYWLRVVDPGSAVTSKPFVLVIEG